MIVSVHYGNQAAILKDVANISVTTNQGFIAEFKHVATASHYLDSLEREGFKVTPVSYKILSLDTTGFTVFEETE